MKRNFFERIVFFACSVKMEELRGSALTELYEKINWTNDVFIKWLQHLKLLHTSRTCQCGEKMRPRKIREGESYPKWQCPVKKCRKEVGFLVGVFFEGTHLTLKEVNFLLSSNM